MKKTKNKINLYQKLDHNKILVYGDFFDKIGNEETVTSYYIIDNENRKVFVQPKNPKNHTEHDSLDFHPAVHANIGFCIKNPDYQEESFYTTPQSIEDHKTGKIIIYYKDNLLKEMKFIGHEDDQETWLIAVYYPDNKNKNAFTKSYYRVRKEKRIKNKK